MRQGLIIQSDFISTNCRRKGKGAMGYVNIWFTLTGEEKLSWGSYDWMEVRVLLGRDNAAKGEEKLFPAEP